MADLKWLDEYSGQSVDELLLLQTEYRIDSLVLAFEQAVDQKSASKGAPSVSEVERVILVVEAVEREVNNGGYGQLFVNAPEFVPLAAESLHRIGCLKSADVTQRAVASLGLANLSSKEIDTKMATPSDERVEELGRCDDLYFKTGEDIAQQLFAFIKANKNAIHL